MSNPSDPSNQDFEVFVQAGESPRAPVSRLVARITPDLVASRGRLAAVYVGGGIAGYAASLAICAQCSIGLTPLASKASSLMMMTIPDPWCAIVCGAVFGIAPFLAALLLLSRFQHRFLLFKLGWIVALLPLLGSGIMTWFGVMHDVTWQVTWVASAILTPYLCEALTAMVLRQRQWHVQAPHSKA